MGELRAGAAGVRGVRNGPLFGRSRLQLLAVALFFSAGYNQRVPELPDIELYLDALRRHVGDQPLREVRIKSPFLLRTVQPSPRDAIGSAIRSFDRLGKRIVFAFDDELFFVLHLMIAGRLQWKKPGAKIGGRMDLAAFDFDEGSLVLTEASKKKRAKLHVVRGADAVAEHDPGGLEPLAIDEATFTRALRERNHTVKRALTDPRIFSGIGNAYSDEILFWAKLPPHRRTQKLTEDELARLYATTRRILAEWRDRLREEVGDGWPKKVTAFRPEMAVHGKYKEPCPVCAEPVQRIAYAGNETNYCARCQNEGKLLADRGLSRLLKGDWPKTLEELEELKSSRKLS